MVYLPSKEEALELFRCKHNPDLLLQDIGYLVNEKPINNPDDKKKAGLNKGKFYDFWWLNQWKERKHQVIYIVEEAVCKGLSIITSIYDCVGRPAKGTEEDKFIRSQLLLFDLDDFKKDKFRIAQELFEAHPTLKEDFLLITHSINSLVEKPRTKTKPAEEAIFRGRGWLLPPVPITKENRDIVVPAIVEYL